MAKRSLGYDVLLMALVRLGDPRGVVASASLTRASVGCRLSDLGGPRELLWRQAACGLRVHGRPLRNSLGPAGRRGDRLARGALTDRLPPRSRPPGVAPARARGPQWRLHLAGNRASCSPA